MTRTEELMNAVRTRIANRALSPGDRLPSVRRFAETMGVSPSTVVEAYDRLAAEGIIRARRGSGFYVTGADLPPMALSEMGPSRERAVDPFWVSRQSLDADASALKPGCGWLPADWMPNAALRKGLRALGRADDALLSDYGSTRGSLALRRLLLGRFADEGITATADQIMLTEYVRLSLRRHITRRFRRGAEHITGWNVGRGIEDTVRAAVRQTSSGSYADLSHEQTDAILEALDGAMQAHDGTPAVLLTAMDVRRFVRKLIERERADLPVLSFQEVADEPHVRVLGTIDLQGAH